MLLILIIKIFGICLVSEHGVSPSTNLQFLKLLGSNLHANRLLFFSGGFSRVIFKLLSVKNVAACFPHSSHEDDIPSLGSENFWSHFSPYQTVHILTVSHLYLIPYICHLTLYLAYSFCLFNITLLALLACWESPSQTPFCYRFLTPNWLLLCKFHFKTHLSSSWPMTPSLSSKKAIQSYS